MIPLSLPLTTTSLHYHHHSHSRITLLTISPIYDAPSALAESSSPNAVFPSEDICTVTEASYFNGERGGLCAFIISTALICPVTLTILDASFPVTPNSLVIRCVEVLCSYLHWSALNHRTILLTSLITCNTARPNRWPGLSDSVKERPWVSSPCACRFHGLLCSGEGSSAKECSWELSVGQREGSRQSEREISGFLLTLFYVFNLCRVGEDPRSVTYNFYPSHLSSAPIFIWSNSLLHYLFSFRPLTFPSLPSPTAQMARALSQAKASEGKFKRRDFIGAIKNANQGSEIPPFIVEINRASLHNGNNHSCTDTVTDTDDVTKADTNIYADTNTETITIDPGTNTNIDQNASALYESPISLHIM